jgi:hypothetical protein
MRCNTSRLPGSRFAVVTKVATAALELPDAPPENGSTLQTKPLILACGATAISTGPRARRRVR